MPPTDASPTDASPADASPPAPPVASPADAATRPAVRQRLARPVPILPSMEAMVFDDYGAADVLFRKTIPTPDPGPHDVLVRVHAAGVNPLDAAVRAGTLRLFGGGGFPKVVGADLAGEVAQTGTAVTDVQPGDAVMGLLGGLGRGSYAQYAVVPRRQLAPLPAGLSFAEAAALPVAAVTALQGLRDAGRLMPRQRLLVNGASGGVGHIAVQLGRRLGAHVTAVCSARNHAFVRDLGADAVVDYRAQEVTDLAARFDLVFDTAGTLGFWGARRILTQYGRFVTTVLGPSIFFWSAVSRLLPTSTLPQTARFVAVRPRATDLELLTRWVEAGEVRPYVSATHPLAEAPAAHRQIETGHTRGKIVLTVG